MGAGELPEMIVVQVIASPGGDVDMQVEFR